MVRLSMKDRKHLERLKGWLNSEHAISEKNHIDPAGNIQRTCVLQIASEPLCRALQQYGVVERKTAGAEAVSTLASNRDFWRGCVDGDGCVYPDGRRVYLSGSERIVRQWSAWGCSIVGRQADVRKHLSFIGKLGCWVGNFNGPAAFDLLRVLYKPGDLWLTRKAVYIHKQETPG